ncbi:MAG: DUF5696 domain-containing protein, partial [Candidatus Thermoplasmatota archaeon]|nr:DUF5696 domain-containing protein [Candidatus Thermoplasmatota archaeon]
EEKMKKILIAGMLIACSTAVFASLDRASVIFKEKEKVPIEEIVQLKEITPNVWRLKIPVSKLDPSKVEYVDVSNLAAEAKKGEDGYFVLPPNILGSFRLDKGSAKGGMAMTMYGMKTPRDCFVAILKGLPYESSTYVDVKDGVYKMKTRTKLDACPNNKPYDDLIIDFYKLDGKDANYSGMGRKYREWQIAEKGVVPLKKRVKFRPELKKSVNDILVRFSHGGKGINKKIEDQTVENEPKINVKNTFDDMIKYMRELKAMGVDDVDVHSVGWNKSGHDGRYPQLFPVEPLFGGEAKLREAIKTAQELGYQITCHTNYTDAFKIADCWDDNLISRNRGGALQKSGVWSGGRAYRPCPRQVLKLRAEKDFDQVAALGFHGLHHIDVITCMTPQPCFSKKHPCSRKDSVDYWCKIMELARAKFGGFSSESSFDFAAKDLDFAFYVSGYPNHMPKKNELYDRTIPLWEIAFHGIILSNPFWETVDPTQPRDTKGQFAFLHKKWKRVLKVMEHGGRPCFYWMNYKKYGMAPVKEIYDMYQPVKYLQYEFMDEHKELAKDVFMTRYGDGSEIITNYSEVEFPYKGENVNAHEYKLFKPNSADAAQY